MVRVRVRLVQSMTKKQRNKLQAVCRFYVTKTGPKPCHEKGGRDGFPICPPNLPRFQSSVRPIITEAVSNRPRNMDKLNFDKIRNAVDDM